jgi:integrase
MPRPSKGPRLWLRPARRNSAGAVSHPARYFILDNGVQSGTGFGVDEAAQAQQALASYIAEKYETKISTEKRDPSVIPIRDVLALYLRDVVSAHVKAIAPANMLDAIALVTSETASDDDLLMALELIRATQRLRPDIKQAIGLQSRAIHRIKRLNAFFGHRMLSDVNGGLCRQYISKSSTSPMARRDLEDLRAAINHHRREGLHNQVISVVLPERQPPRERWLEREEAAQLLWDAWRRPKCKQVAKFVLVALYTGRRAAVVCSASFVREEGRTWVDLKRGFLRPPERARKTKKRNPPIPLPAGLLAHLRRWHAAGSRYVVQWGDHSVGRVDKTVAIIAADAGLGHVTPHVLRHTAATWQMQAGTDLWEASKYLGMTVRTLEQTYGHHRPQHLTQARDAYRRMDRQRFANEKDEREANRTPQNTTENHEIPAT